MADYGQTISLDIKALNDEGTFEGYASVFGELDNRQDIVMPGAFSDTLVTRPVNRVKLLFQHETDEIIGKWLEMREDTKGLYVKGQLFRDLSRGSEVYTLMKNGVLDGLSIGFRTNKYEIDNTTGVRRLLKVELFEVSVVTFPMLETALISNVKEGSIPTERDLEKCLRDAGFSSRQAKTIISGGYKKLLSERDAGEDDKKASQDAINKLIGVIKNASSCKEN